MVKVISYFCALMLKRVLVTGAGGLLGSNIVRELLKRGIATTVLVRQGKRYPTLENLDIRWAHGDIMEIDSVKAAMEDCDGVIHAAAETSPWPSRSPRVREVNITGTRHLLEVALAADIARFVFVSTANTLGFGTKENPGHEDVPCKSWGYGLDYMDSKYEAQELVLATAAKEKMAAVVVNPTFIFGPYDVKPNSGEMVLSIYKGKIPGYTSGGKNCICATDAAIGTVNALLKGKSGECYLLANENMTYRELFEKIAKVVGVNPPKLFIPAFLAKTAGLANTTLYNAGLLKKPPQLSLPVVRISCDGHYFTAAKAIRELDLPQTPVEQGIRECFEWMKANGYIS